MGSGQKGAWGATIGVDSGWLVLLDKPVGLFGGEMGVMKLSVVLLSEVLDWIKLLTGLRRVCKAELFLVVLFDSPAFGGTRSCKRLVICCFCLCFCSSLRILVQTSSGLRFPKPRQEIVLESKLLVYMSLPNGCIYLYLIC